MKFKNYGFWTSLAGSTVVVAGVITKTFGVEISSEVLTDIIMGIAGVLVVLGVVKMPKNKKEQIKENDNDEQEKNENQIKS